MPAPSFDGLAVLSLESRRAAEQATIIERLNGRPVVAPSMREVPLESQAEAASAIDAVIAGHFDAIVFLTGVGLRAWLTVAEHHGRRDAFVAALGSTRVLARGPKPLAVLREIGVPVWIVAPEPNTWRELLDAIDVSGGRPLEGARVAVQEYGVSNPPLLRGLADRGATVTAIPIYQWVLPEDTAPLRSAVGALARGEIDVVILTSGVQLAHLFQVAEDMGEESALVRALGRVVIASIGPTTSEEIRRRGLEPDLEASHPKMGILVTEAAARSRDLLAAKRG